MRCGGKRGMARRAARVREDGEASGARSGCLECGAGWGVGVGGLSRRLRRPPLAGEQPACRLGGRAARAGGGGRRAGQLACPRPNLRRAPFSVAHADKPRHRPGSRPRMVQEPRQSPPRSDHAAGDRRRDVLHGRLERRLRGERQDRRRAVAFRSAHGQALHSLRLLRRRHQPRHGRLQGQALLRHLRRPLVRARSSHRREIVGCGHQPSSLPQPLHRNRRAARGAGQGVHRPEQLRVRAARLPLRLRCEHRRVGVALLHGARGSVQAVRASGTRGGGEDVERAVVETRRRRHGVERHRLRRGL